MSSLTVQAGIYQLKSLSSGKLLDGAGNGSSPASLINGDISSPNNVRWVLRDIGNGVFTIKNLSSGFYLDGRNPTDSIVLASTTNNRTPATDKYFHWTVESLQVVEQGAVVYRIRSVSSNKFLDGRNNDTYPATPFVTDSSATQPIYLKWHLVSARVFQLKSISSGKLLDGSGNVNQALLAPQSMDPGERKLQWVVNDLGNDVVSFTCQASMKFLDGRNNGHHDAFVTARDASIDPYARWTIEAQGTFDQQGAPIFKLRSLSSNKYLDGRNPDTVPPEAFLTPDKAGNYLLWVLVPIAGNI